MVGWKNEDPSPVSPSSRSEVSTRTDASVRGAEATDDGRLGGRGIVFKKKYVNLVDSKRFAVLMGFFVTANVVTIGLETDLTYDNPAAARMFATINQVFLLIFITEIIMRLIYNGGKALQDVLTLVDVFLVIFPFVERVITDRGVGRALPVLRLIRVFKALTKFKMFRTARELWQTVNNTFEALKTLFWNCAILGLFLCAMATFCKIVIGESAEWVGTMDPLDDHEAFEPFDNREYFGSVSRSFFTLMQVITVAHWADHIARPVAQVYPVMNVFFFAFLFIITYGLLKCVVASIMLDSMLTSRVVDKAVEEQRLEERRIAADSAEMMFKTYDVNEDGTLDFEELNEAMKGSEFPKVLKELDIPDMDAESLILLFDRDGNGYLEYKELLEGLAMMGNDIEPTDIAMLAIWVYSLLQKARHLQERIHKLAEELTHLTKTLKGGFDAVDHFLKTKDSSDLRNKALKMIREAGPETVPNLVGTVEEIEYLPRSDLAGVFINFARRFLGMSPQASSRTAARSRLRTAADGGLSDDDSSDFSAVSPTTLPDAPSSFLKQVAIAKRTAEARAYRPMGKYDMKGASPSPQLAQLREVLSMSPHGM